MHARLLCLGGGRTPRARRPRAPAAAVPRRVRGRDALPGAHAHLRAVRGAVGPGPRQLQARDVLCVGVISVDVGYTKQKKTDHLEWGGRGSGAAAAVCWGFEAAGRTPAVTTPHIVGLGATSHMTARCMHCCASHKGQLYKPLLRQIAMPSAAVLKRTNFLNLSAPAAGRAWRVTARPRAWAAPRPVSACATPSHPWPGAGCCWWAVGARTGCAATRGGWTRG